MTPTVLRVREGKIFFMRTLPDGTATSFTIPAGKMLIITDVNWQIEAGNPGTVARLLLRIENLANPSLIRNVHNSVLTLNSAGVNGNNERLSAGIVVSYAARITANLNVPTGALGGLYLIGYLRRKSRRSLNYYWTGFSQVVLPGPTRTVDRLSYPAGQYPIQV
jgi:hypothetical protein